MRGYGFTYIRLYYIYILCILYIHMEISVISIFTSKMLKRFFEFITLFYEKILTLNIFIIGIVVCNYFIPFPEFVYISLYNAIYILETSILSIRIFIFNEKRFEKVFKGILEEAFGETNYFVFWVFFII